MNIRASDSYPPEADTSSNLVLATKKVEIVVKKQSHFHIMEYVV